MRKILVTVIAAALMAASGGVLLSGDAFGVPLQTCDTGSPFPGTPLTGTVNANLYVPSGALCNIQGAIVNGNIKVEPGGGLIIGSGSTVNGNVTSYKAGSFPGNPCTGGGGSFSVVLGSRNTFNGVVSIKLSTADVIVGGGGCGSETVKYQLYVENNGAKVTVVGNKIGGNAFINSNTPGPTIIQDNAVTGNLYCSGNGAVTSSGNTASHISGTDC